MQTSPPASDAARLQQYAGTLIAAHTQLAYVRGTDVAAPERADRTLTNLHAANEAIHRGLLELGALPAGIPGGATSYAREAAARVLAAIGEVSRTFDGAAIDANVVNRAVEGAMGKLATANSLVRNPPTDVVYDGS
jgi:hypothetical protein